ncbi:MAG: TIGR03663 family protein [Chloroflexi bacterium]|nr:TIGR03663 family protein [Chloroflexota bacterium]
MSERSPGAVGVEEPSQPWPETAPGTPTERREQPRRQEAAGTWARWELAAYLVIVVAALVLRLWGLGDKAFHHDESLHASYAWYLYDGRGYRHDPMMHGPFQFFGTALMFQLFGDSDFTARLLYALYGTALVVLPVFLRDLLGRYGALVTSLLLAVSPTMLYFSRFARNDILMAVWALALVTLVWRYLRRQRVRHLVLGSAVLAFAFSTKETAYILTAVLGSYLLVAARRDVVPWLLGRKALRDFAPPGQVLVLLATLSLPLGAGAASILQKPLGLELANPDYTRAPVGIPLGTGLYVAFLLVVGLLMAGIGLGLRWRPRVWLACAAAFATVWVLLYTSFFTNFWGGLASGLWQSVGYWVVQQDVARGGQPWYYYLVVGLNYEFLPLLMGLVAMGFYLKRGDEFSRFLVFWAVGSFAFYTYAAEKMPWLLVNVALPFIVLAGKFLGDLLARQPWLAERSPVAQRALVPEGGDAGAVGMAGVPEPSGVDAAPEGSLAPAAESRVAEPGPGATKERYGRRGVAGAVARLSWPALAFAGMLVLLVALAGRGLGLVLRADVQSSVGLLLTTGLVVAALLGACGYLLGKVPRGKRGPLAGVGVAAIMLALTVQASLRSAYANADVPVDMLVYTQTSPEIPQLVREIRRLGAETGKGERLKVIVDTADGFAWPWVWYLRDFPTVSYLCLGSDPGCQGMTQAPDADVVLVDAPNQASASRFLEAYGPPIRYKHRWWFPESYRGLNVKTVAEAVRQRQSWCRVLEYFLDRRFDLSIGSVDAYAYFPSSFSPAPLKQRDQERTRC